MVFVNKYNISINMQNNNNNNNNTNNNNRAPVPLLSPLRLQEPKTTTTTIGQDGRRRRLRCDGQRDRQAGREDQRNRLCEQLRRVRGAEPRRQLRLHPDLHPDRQGGLDLPLGSRDQRQSSAQTDGVHAVRWSFSAVLGSESATAIAEEVRLACGRPGPAADRDEVLLQQQPVGESAACQGWQLFCFGLVVMVLLLLFLPFC